MMGEKFNLQLEMEENELREVVVQCFGGLQGKSSLKMHSLEQFVDDNVDNVNSTGKPDSSEVKQRGVSWFGCSPLRGKND